MAFVALAALLAVACRGDQPVPVSTSRALVVYGTTDAAVFRPVIDDFGQLYPKVRVRYVELEAGPLYRRYLAERAAHRPRADLLLSSAMDLQVKLVNDGFAAAHASANVAKLPVWARWRQQAFGITFEPAVIVYNARVLTGRRAPRSRPDLIEALKGDRTFWRGKIGTYDIATSSVGYLLASQDARQSSHFGSMIETLGAADVKTFSNTAAILDRLESGELAVGYNLLGSYARARAEKNPSIVIVYPLDYTLAVSRTAVLPSDAPHPEVAHAFLEYLVSLRGQRVLSAQSRLSAVRGEIEGPYSRLGIAERQIGPLRPIPLGPGLLVYLDEAKRKRLLDSWQRAVNEPPPTTMMTAR